MGRFKEFSIKELEILEVVLCQEGIGYLVDEVRMEWEKKKERDERMEELLRWKLEVRNGAES